MVTPALPLVLMQSAPSVQVAAAPAAAAPGALAFSDFWGLADLAGPLRWPIFATLAVGLWLSIHKLYELLRDRSLGRELLALDLRSLDLAQIRARVAAQPEHMLSSLQATMLNAHRAGTGESTLHDEITSFAASQQDLFERFRRRMDFLSDTAGALGLLGTVWGMFEVFFQGTPDRDVILRGMGIALMTTLLGLVVSIILNLATTEIFTFFGSRLQQVTKKGDELRFRLLELTAPSNPVATIVHEPPTRVQARSGIAPSASSPRAPVPAPDSPSGATPSRSTIADGWCDLEVSALPQEVRAGELVRGIELQVQGRDGRLPDGVGVDITGPSGAHGQGKEELRMRLKVGADGLIKFDWPAPTTAGPLALEAAVVGHSGARRRLELRVLASAPEHVELSGNHQAAVAGMRLANPLVVHVRDRYDNPVPEVPVSLKVTSGGGRLGTHGATAYLRTDASGAARAPFAVASDAGANVVAVSIDGRDEPLEFVAFGTAV